MSFQPLAVANAGAAARRAPQRPPWRPRTPGRRRLPTLGTRPGCGRSRPDRVLADGTPRASGFGARPAPGDGGGAGTRPAAIPASQADTLLPDQHRH